MTITQLMTQYFELFRVETVDGRRRSIQFIHEPIPMETIDPTKEALKRAIDETVDGRTMGNSQAEALRRSIQFIHKPIPMAATDPTKEALKRAIDDTVDGLKKNVVGRQDRERLDEALKRATRDEGVFRGIRQGG